jgi:ubiquinol-cytochrome c reductase iron-sulfur subunit
VSAPIGEDHATPTPVTVRLDAPQYQVAAANPAGMEKAVALLFLIGLAGFAGFGAAYWVNATNLWLGMTMGVGFLGLGVGMVAWGKYLMPRGPFSESRHSMIQTEADKRRIIEDFSSRGKVVIERRSFLAKILGAASAIFGIVVAFPLIRSLGPVPKDFSIATTWHPGSFLVNVNGDKVHEDDLAFGGMLTVFPEGDAGGALSQTMLIRQLPPTGQTNIVTAPGRETWGPNGYLAFSKVCTHAGCPVGLYQQQTHQLLCPCHQSLFDVGPGHAADPVFGPAPRPLPQLPLFIDADGYLRAQAAYDEPVGPGYWYRGND